MLIVVIIVALLMVLLEAVRPISSELSSFELSRRVDEGDKVALKQWRRNDLFTLVQALQEALRIMLIIALSAAAIAEFGWLIGILLTAAVGLWHQWLSRLIHKPMQNLYQKHESSILKFAQKFRTPLKSLRQYKPLRQSSPVASREELLHVVSQNTNLTSQSERQLFQGVLSYESQLVSAHMTRRGMIKSVDAEELIGPLVLDDLHKTGHDHFPVRDGDVDRIVGMLHIHDLASLKIKQSAKARDLMTHAVNFIDEDATVASALKIFTNEAPALLIVKNAKNETTGVLALKDVVDVLFGIQK